MEATQFLAGFTISRASTLQIRSRILRLHAVQSRLGHLEPAPGIRVWKRYVLPACESRGGRYRRRDEQNTGEPESPPDCPRHESGMTDDASPRFPRLACACAIISSREHFENAGRVVSTFISRNISQSTRQCKPVNAPFNRLLKGQ
jgi:hypothetical protein